MAEPLLWSLDEAARQLGGVSTRTVRRLIDRRQLAVVRIGRTVRVEVASVRAYVERSMRPAHNLTCAGPNVPYKGEGTCRSANRGGIRTASTNVPTLRTTGRRTSTQAARELDALLVSESQLKGEKRPRHS